VENQLERDNLEEQDDNGSMILNVDPTEKNCED